MPIDRSDEIWTMIRNYLSHFTNGRAGEPDFTKLKHEVENDPVVVLERINRNFHRKILPQRKLASYSGFANQQTIDRFRTVKNKSIDKIRRMTVVLGLFTGLGRKLL